MKELEKAPEHYRLAFDIVRSQFLEKYCTEEHRMTSIEDLTEVFGHFFLWGVSCCEQRYWKDGE